MVTEALRQVMLAAEGAGTLEGPGVRRGSAEHPVCGDLVEIDLQMQEGRVGDLCWRASGCPATMAVVAACRAALLGQPPSGFEAALRQRLQRLGGLQAHERHAEALVLRALDRALQGGGG